MSANKKVAIIGSGLIGRSWAMIFASSGYRVQLYDTNSELLAKARDLIAAEFASLIEKNLARGTLTLDERMSLISTTESLVDCIKDSIHIQECVFEDLALKQSVFKEVDNLLGDNHDAAICSSTSVNLPSLLFNQMSSHKSQCLVAHPINPPAHVRLVELIPSSETSKDILIKTRLLMDEVGQRPVILNKEVSGFALNRLQFAVFQEAFRLVRDGVMSPEDVDTVVSDGLGPRYAFMGPWMTAHLNANGMPEYFEKYAKGVYDVSLDCQPVLKLEGEAATQISDAMCREVPIDKLPEKRAWRDRCLIELSQIKSRLGTM